MIKGILNFGKTKSVDTFESFINRLSEFYKYAPSDFGGGCSFQKALTLAFFIKEFNYKNSVDIGVYRGRSLFPQALSHKEFAKGTVFAVDPYSNLAAVQNDREDIKNELKKFAEVTDFDKIFNDVNTLIAKFKLKNQVKFIRLKSSDAAEFFQKSNIKFGLIHIDGNHDTKYVMQDVQDYFPLLEENGMIVLDDISWQSVKPAYDWLNERMVRIGECIDANNDFAVYISKGQNEKRKVAEKLFEDILEHKQ